MIIAVEKGLKYIKGELEKRGYDTFYIGERSVADAIIYKNRDSHPYFQVSSAPITTLSSLNPNTIDSGGVFLINAENKSFEEILKVLERKTYSPLF